MKKHDFTDKSYATPTGRVYKVKIGGPVTTDGVVEYLKANEFDFVNEAITQKNFPLRPHAIKEVEIEIIYPGRPFTESEGLLFLKNAGLRRPTKEHALRFVEQYGKRAEGNSYVVFLHKHWSDPSLYISDDRNRLVLYLNHHFTLCELNLVHLHGGFGKGCVLAGVRRAIK